MSKAREVERNMDDPYYHRLGKRLKSARLQMGWSLRQLSKETSISEADLSQIERNVLRAKLEHVRRIARIAGQPLSAFLEVDEDEFRPGAIIPPGEEPWAWRVTDRNEQKLLTEYRDLRPKEQRIVVGLCELIVRSRPRASEPRAVKKLRDLHDILIPT